MPSAEHSCSSTASHDAGARTIVATTIGNALEFFDFTVYGFLALVIGKLFFPTFDSYGQLLLTVASFGVGFIMRPLGGIVIGAYADRAGRKKAMTLTIFLMALGCAMIAWRRLTRRSASRRRMLIVLARLIQGFSAGGEVGASTTLLVEHATPANRGYMASWQFASQGLGILLGAVVVGLLSATLSPAAMESWGWRVPFVLGMLIAPVGMYIRRHLEESLDVTRAGGAGQARRSSLSEVCTRARPHRAGGHPEHRRRHRGGLRRDLLHADLCDPRTRPAAAGGAVRRRAHRPAVLRPRALRRPLVGPDRPQAADRLEPHRAGADDLSGLPLAQRVADAGGAVHRGRPAERRAGDPDRAGHHDAAGDVPQARARQRHVAGLQRRRGAVRRLLALHQHLAAECHRQQAGAGLVPAGA